MWEEIFRGKHVNIDVLPSKIQALYKYCIYGNLCGRNVSQITLNNCLTLRENS